MVGTDRGNPLAVEAAHAPGRADPHVVVAGLMESQDGRTRQSIRGREANGFTGDLGQRVPVAARGRLRWTADAACGDRRFGRRRSERRSDRCRDRSRAACLNPPATQKHDRLRAAVECGTGSLAPRARVWPALRTCLATACLPAPRQRPRSAAHDPADRGEPAPLARASFVPLFERGETVRRRFPPTGGPRDLHTAG